MQIFVRIIYNLVIALLVSFAVGFGISVFYPAPPEPAQTYIPPCAPTIPLNGASNNQSIAQPCSTGSGYVDPYLKYQSDLKIYYGWVGEIGMAFAVIFAVVGILLYFKLPFFSPGFTFGALGIFFYSLNRAVSSANSRLEFAIVIVALIMVLIEGYIFFLRGKVNNTSS